MEISTEELEGLLYKGFETLASYYQSALADHINDTYNLDDLFLGHNAEKFICNCFKQERKNKKIRNCIDRITPFRAIHTVSSFLLGLTIRDKLHIDTRSWLHLPGEKSPKGSFELFWSWICLFHDVGYYYEEHSETYASYNTIAELMQSLGIKHDLLDVSENKTLIKKYYRKRINSSDPKVDHGIVGALLLYDALMDLAKDNKVYSEIIGYRLFLPKFAIL